MTEVDLYRGPCGNEGRDTINSRHLLPAVLKSSTFGAEISSVTKQPAVLGKLGKWAMYDSCCTGPVPPSRFLPMKTPLSEACFMIITSSSWLRYHHVTYLQNVA